MTDNLEDEHCPRGMKAAPRQNALASKMGWYQLDLSPTPTERAAGKTVTSKPFISDQWVGTPKTYAEAKWDMITSPWNLLPGGGYRWNLADYEGAKAFEKTVRDHNPDYCINLAGDIDYDGTKCINWYNPDTLEICKDTGKFEAGDCVRHGSACCPHDCGTCPGNPDAKTKIECETLEPEEEQACQVRASSVYKDARAACVGVGSAYHSCVEANCKQREYGELECERQCKDDSPGPPPRAGFPRRLLRRAIRRLWRWRRRHRRGLPGAREGHGARAEVRSLPFLLSLSSFSLRSEKTRRLSRDATK